MARAGLDTGVVLQAAVAIADEDGFAALTLAGLAASLGVKSPSLYNHIRSLEHVRDSLTTQALRMLVERSRYATTGLTERATLAALGEAQRQFAKEHPGLWAAFKLPASGWSRDSRNAAEA